MGKKKTTQRSRIDFDQFAKMMADESDRGCVLIGYEAIHINLEELVRSYLSPDETAAKLIAEHLSPENTNALLGDFFAKETLALMMGIIDADTHQALKALRKLRIDAAHVAVPFTLDVANSHLATLVSKTHVADKLEILEGVHDKMLAELGDRWFDTLKDMASGIDDKFGIRSRGKLRLLVALFSLGIKLDSLSKTFVQSSLEEIKQSLERHIDGSPMPADN